MNFEKLCNIILEQSEWTYSLGIRDLQKQFKSDTSVKNLENKYKRILTNSFALLANDPSFDIQIQQIYNTFNRSREGLKNITDIGGEKGPKKYDEESKLDSLGYQILKLRGDIESQKEIVNYFNEMYSYAINSDPSLEHNLNLTISKFSDSLSTINSKIKSLSKTKSISKKFEDITRFNRELSDIEKNLKLAIKEKTNPKKSSQLDARIAKLNLKKKEINDKLKSATYANYVQIQNIKQTLEDDIDKSNKLKTMLSLSPTAINHLMEQLTASKEKLSILTKKLENAEIEYSNIITRLEESRIALENANNKALAKVIDTVINSAVNVSEKIQEELGNYIPTEETVDFEEVPKKLIDKAKMAIKLTSSDFNENPVIDFIENLNQLYYNIPVNSEVPLYDPNSKVVKSYIAGQIIEPGEKIDLFPSRTYNEQEHSKNVNITKQREFNRLPFVQFIYFYNNKSKVRMPIERTALDNQQKDNEWYKKAFDELNNFFGNFKNTNDQNLNRQYEKAWNDINVKYKIRDLILALGLGDKINNPLIMRLKQPFRLSRSGMNSFQQLLSSIYSDSKYLRDNSNTTMKNEHTNNFDKLYESLLEDIEYDEDDFKLGLIEIFSEAASKKCTGPTKKTSSTRKGKKWTKCARQPDGSYKRIHWGQKGVKVTGKSGNTKRKKSFRARHKCGSAKPGSPQQAACADW